MTVTKGSGPLRAAELAASVFSLVLLGCGGPSTTAVGFGGAGGSGVAGFGGAGSTCRETVRLAPSADTYIDALEPTSTHGTSLTLKVGTEVAGDRYRMLVAFDLEGAVPSNAQFLNAWLELQASLLPDLQPMPTTVHRLTRAFDEDSATWEEFQLDDAWMTPGGDFDARAAASLDRIDVETLTTFEVFEDFARQLSEGVPYYGWMIRSRGGASTEFHSRERAPGISPMLVLEYCPG